MYGNCVKFPFQERGYANMIEHVLVDILDHHALRASHATLPLSSSTVFAADPRRSKPRNLGDKGDPRFERPDLQPPFLSPGVTGSPTTRL